MAMFMKEIGKMIKLMVTEFIIILMVLIMKGNGRMIFRMGMESKHGRIIPDMKDFTKKEKR